MNKNNIITVTVVILVIAAAGFLFAFSNPTSKINLGPFAQCLTDKGVVMYGAAWCTHCQAQKKMFGDAFKNIKYVECPEHADECTAKGVTGFPTWINANGEKFVGEQTVESLAKASGCEVPKN